MARCEWACYDTMKCCNDVTQEFQDELHRPAFPYKYKIKYAGCPNDCVASVARADLSVIGTWKDDIQVDQAAISQHHKSVDVKAEVVDLCPTQCMSWDGSKLQIDNSNCVKCMHCINVLNRALKPGKERGATLLLGAKAPIIGGALLSSVLVPFVPADEVLDACKELSEAIWDEWGENGKNRERVGEYIQRIGMGNFLERIGLEPVPEMVVQPRTNPYIFFEAEGEE
jgi:sulfite reductase alpha subunit